MKKLFLLSAAALVFPFIMKAQESTPVDTLPTHFDTFLDGNQANASMDEKPIVRINAGANSTYFRYGIIAFDMSQVTSIRDKVEFAIYPYMYNTSDDFFKTTVMNEWPVGIFALNRKPTIPTTSSQFFSADGDNFKMNGSFPKTLDPKDGVKVTQGLVQRTDSGKFVCFDVTDYVNEHINTNDTIYFLLTSTLNMKTTASLYLKSMEASPENSARLFLYAESHIAVMQGGRDIYYGDKDSVRIFFPSNTNPPYQFTYTDGTNRTTITDWQERTYAFEVSPTDTVTYQLVEARDEHSSMTLKGEAVFNVLMPKAVISGQDKVYSGDKAEIVLNFYGVAPFSATVSGPDLNETYTNIMTSSLSIPFLPTQDGVYTITEASDANNPSITTEGSAKFTLLFRPQPTVIGSSEKWDLVFGDEFASLKLKPAFWTTLNGEASLSDDVLHLPIVKVGESLVASQVKYTHRLPTDKDMFVEVRMKIDDIKGVGGAVSTQTYSTSMSSQYQQRFSMAFPSLTRVGRGNWTANYTMDDWKTSYYIKDINPDLGFNQAKATVDNVNASAFVTFGMKLTGKGITFYINGREASNGDKMTNYNDGLIADTLTALSTAFADVAQKAYGYYGQDDWQYRGGYTGDWQSLVLGAAMNNAEIEPSAAGAMAIVDYVRIYTIQQEPNVSYFSAVVNKGEDAALNLTVSDNENQVVGGAVINRYNQLQTGFGDAPSYYASTVSAEPKNKKENYCLPNQMYLMVGRVELNPEGDDNMSMSLLPILDEWEQPYYYYNVAGDYGHTSLNQGWDINQRIEAQVGVPTQGKATVTGEGNVQALRFGSTFASVLPTESFAILSDGLDYVDKGAHVDMLVNFKGVAPYSLVYTDGTDNYTVDGITTQTYYLSIEAQQSNTYSLVSVTDGNGNPGIAFGSHLVKVKSDKAQVIYPYFDSYVDMYNHDTKPADNPDGLIKKHATWQRDAYFNFDISELDPNDSIDVASFSFFIANNDQGASAILSLYEVKKGLPEDLNELCWDMHPDDADLSLIAELNVPNPGFDGVRAMWDMTKFINTKLRDEAGVISLAVKQTGGTSALLTWKQAHPDNAEDTWPMLEVDPYQDPHDDLFIFRNNKLNQTVPCFKYIRQGQLLIRRGDKVYTVTGLTY